ncbi:MAG: hypothetical protein P4L41_03205 [Flavipsychrobacter sp.]|nr:hypothetical protein [Flavipsychrobacter sp.]
MKYILSLSIIAAAFCLFISCKKSSSGGVKGMLEARWKSEETGIDKNGNGILDSNEVTHTDSLNNYRVFNSDGSGSDIGADLGNYPIPFQWAVSTDNTYLRIIDTTNSAIIFHIDLISNSQLILKDTAGGIYTWNVYKKS